MTPRGAKGAGLRRSRDPLLSLPGIGPSLAGDLRELGFRAPPDLRDRDPERMFRDLCARRGGPIDRCVLYAFRCAVYFASNDTHDPDLLKWWNWKDRANQAPPDAPAGLRRGRR
ncbi:MAG: helix-hairpin-helix domain-containing protein [Candidatus Eisenbacteria bacterium]